MAIGGSAEESCVQLCRRCLLEVGTAEVHRGTVVRQVADGSNRVMLLQCDRR